MNALHLSKLCNIFKLGTPLQVPQRVYGGLLHSMWRLDTNKGSYAIKQLSKDIDLTNESIINNYNLTEIIASLFSTRGVPVVCALEQLSKYLTIIDGTGFLVYPWIDAKTLDKDVPSEHHALKIAGILAKMHLINLNVPEILKPVFDFHSNAKIILLIEKAQKFDCPFANNLTKNQQTIFAANNDYHHAIPALTMHAVISHGDLDQKNVLWDENNNPILIDWESARKLNSTYEIVNACLDWSGIATNLNHQLFAKMIQEYQKAGRIVDRKLFEAAFHGCLGNLINWMVYNIERSCNTQDTEQKPLGIAQEEQTLMTILRLQKMIPELIKIREMNTQNNVHVKLKAPLSNEIVKKYEKLINLVQQVPAQNFFDKNFNGSGGNVSVADILAYQIGWGYLLISWYEHGLKNEVLIMPGEGFSTWDYTALAQHFYKKYSQLTSEQLEQKFLEVVTKIIDITELEFSSGNLDKLGVWPWCRLKSGKEWPLSKWIRVNTVAPYKRARLIIKQKLLLSF